MHDMPPSDATGSNTPSSTSSHDDSMNIITSTIDTLTPCLRSLSLDIHDNPELRYKEIHAHEVLTAFLREKAPEGQDWKVTPGAYGIGTAFVGVFEGEGKGEGPVVSFNAEFGMLDLFHLMFGFGGGGWGFNGGDGGWDCDGGSIGFMGGSY